jgi:hypothetical protein
LSRLLFFLAALPLAAQAALPDEIQVYTDDLEEVGARGIELHVNTTPNGRKAPAYPGEVVPHHGLRVTPEISWGLAENWDGGVYLPFVRSGDGAYFFAGPRLRLKYLPLRPAEGSAGMFAGINFEASFVQHRFEEAGRTLEIRPIIGYRGEKWLFSFNPILDTDLAGEHKGELTFAPAVKVSRRAWPGMALGVEYYADMGKLSDLAPRDEQSRVLYVTADTDRVNFGIGYGLTNAADRWTVKAIFSF